MDEAPAMTSKAPVVRMGIRGLPDLATGMLGGGLYVLIAKTTSARFPMLASSIATALDDGVASAVVVSANPAQFIQRIETLVRIETLGLIASQRLQLFALQDNFLKKMFQHGAGRFVSELEDFEIPENSFLVFDQADELLSLHDVSLAYEQVTVLKEWFAKKNITALLVFSRLTDAHGSTVNAIMDSLDGIVRLGGEKDGLTLSFDYWQSPTAVTVAKNYHLMTLDTGLYEASMYSNTPMLAMREEVQPPKTQLLGRQSSGLEAVARRITQADAAKLEKHRGYLKPLDFLREVERILDQADPLANSCTLVVGIAAQGIEMIDIVNRFDRSSRAGDLITADDQHCYMYQHTDSTSLALDNLQIMLGLPVAAVFNQNKLLNDPAEIRSTLVDLLQAVKRGDCPDFSSIHDAAPLPPSPSSLRPRFGDHVKSHAHDGMFTRPIETSVKHEPTQQSDTVLLMGFEPAKRSSTPYTKIFNRLERSEFGNFYIRTKAESVEDIVFDAEEDAHGPVFGKADAPRATRSFS